MKKLAGLPMSWSSKASRTTGSPPPFATARAVADLGLLCEMCLPFVKVGGRFLAMKGPECQEELDRAARAIPTLGGVLKGCYDYRIPHTDITHRVVVVEKVAPCPAKYPRRWAKMQKAPL